MRHHTGFATWFPATPVLRRSLLALTALSLMCGPSIASAMDISFHDAFNVTLQGNAVVGFDAPSGLAGQGGVNTGYNQNNPNPGDGPWYTYDNGWINQWFFNADEILGSKDIQWDFTVQASHDAGFQIINPTIFEVAINWSSESWNNEAGGGGIAPPLPPGIPGDSPFIIREVLTGVTGVSAGTGENPVAIQFQGNLNIPDFNPQWVSIDVRVLQDGTTEAISIPFPGQAPFITLEGDIWHTHHVPEPSTYAALLSLAGVGLTFGAYRKRKVSK